MTKKKMPVGRPFQPGQSGNPAGRGKLPEELRQYKELTPEEVKRMFAKYARMGEAGIDEAMNEDDTPMFEKVIASGLKRALKDGDYAKLNFILDRTIGKVAEKTSIDLPEPLIIKRRNGDEVYLAAEKKAIE